MRRYEKEQMTAAAGAKAGAWRPSIRRRLPASIPARTAAPVFGEESAIILPYRRFSAIAGLSAPTRRIGRKLPPPRGAPAGREPTIRRPDMPNRDLIPQNPADQDLAGSEPPVAKSATPPGLDRLADRARGYAEAASSANTRRAYAADWRHFSAWCRRQGLDVLPPSPPTVGLYIAACASGGGAASASSAGGVAGASRASPGRANAVSTIERRLSALVWGYAQRGTPLDRKDRHIATVLAGVRNTHAAPPRRKEAILPQELIAMLETLERGSLRGLRDRAILLLGFSGALRRSEIVGLDVHRDDTEDGRGWIEILADGLVVALRGKTGWREVEIGRGSSAATCPVAALETWLRLARIGHGPLFRRVRGEGREVGPERLGDPQVARLVKRAALAAGVRPELSLAERAEKFSGHSLRAGLASSAEVDERYVQKHLGHASAEMTRRYQRRRDRFRVNLTKAAGL
jgi:integrase